MEGPGEEKSLPPSPSSTGSGRSTFSNFGKNVIKNGKSFKIYLRSHQREWQSLPEAFV